jgi:broad specificity phosphatase PhoE
MNDPSHPDATAAVGTRPRTAVWRFLGVALISFVLLIGAAIPAAAAELMRVTFIRHGESYGNSSGLIDTSTPGPVLTPLGQQQARDIAAKLGDNNYDAIYASSMVRTQLTAAPMSQYLGMPITVLPGLQEIEAGVFEGTPEAGAQGGYGLYPIGWTFPGVIPQIPVEMFNKDTFMPGTNLNGHVFDARVDGALQSMYDNGDRNAVVFSHGGTIMFWTMMNVQNLTVMEKLQLLQTAQMDNTDYVVIEGNNEDGWTLVNWNGQQFSPEPTLGAEVKLQMRTLTRQLTATAQEVSAAFATRDFATIATAINRGVAEAKLSVIKFGRAVTAKVIHEVDQVIRRVFPAPAPAPSSSNALTVKTADESAESAQPLKDVTDPAPTTARKSKAVAEPETKPVKVKEDAVSNGATDLTNGNKVVPGEPATGATTPSERVQDDVTDVSDPVATAVTKLKEAAKRFVAPKSANPGTAGATATDGTNGADSGSQQGDAA